MSAMSVVAGLYEAFGKGDIPSVLEKFDPEVHWHEAESNPYMPTGEAWIGPDAILENLFVKLGEDWDGFTVHPEFFHDAGDAIVMEGRYAATHKGTGKPLDVQVCHVWTLKDDKITKFQQYVDTVKLREAMGEPVG